MLRPVLTLVGGVLQFTASWTAPASDGGQPVTKYVLDYRKGISGTWTSVDVTALTTTITGLTVGSYQVRVAAVSPIGTGGHSATHLATVTGLTVPGVPRSLTVKVASAPQTSHMRMDWLRPTTDGGSSITKYELQYNAYTSQQTPDFTGRSLINRGPHLDHTQSITLGYYYYWRVRAVNAIGNGPWTAAVEFRIT